MPLKDSGPNNGDLADLTFARNECIVSLREFLHDFLLRFSFMR